MADDENQAPAENNEAPAEAPAAAEEKPAEENDALLDKTHDSFHRVVAEGEMCCCCICHCSRPETKNLSCFGCFPIKCGIISIGVLTLFLILSSLVEIYAMLLNEGIHWWYVLVSLVLLIPTILAATFLIAFFNADTGSRRAKLRVACIFVIISFSLLAVWNICYFNFWYKKEDVEMGQNDWHFKQTKKQYVFWSVFISLVVDGFYAYFICVVARYRNALRKDEEAEKEAEAKKAAEQKAADEAEGKGCCSCC